jgi:hypothetical protein
MSAASHVGVESWMERMERMEKNGQLHSTALCVCVWSAQ